MIWKNWEQAVNITRLTIRMLDDNEQGEFTREFQRIKTMRNQTGKVLVRCLCAALLEKGKGLEVNVKM